jgi:phage I-like protein
MDLRTLADLPELAALAEGEELPTTRIPVAKLGSYRDRRYGAFSITAQDFASWKRNLEGPLGGRAPIDFDHAPEKGQGTKAAGWITGLELDGKHVMGTVQWSRAGVEAIKGREYAYISPTFTRSWRDEEGRDHGRTLIGAGLTNRPFLKKDMPAISLSEDLELTARESQPLRDSPAVTPLANIAQRLSTEETTLSEAVQGAGAIILTAAEHTDLVARANAGEQAVQQLAEQTFELAFTKALDEGRTTPAMKEHLQGLPVETAVKILEASPKVVKTETKGSGDAGRTPETPKGVDADRFELHEKAEALALSEKISYEDALERVVMEG